MKKLLYSLMFLWAIGQSTQVSAQCSVFAGGNQSVCSNQSTIVLSGTANDNVYWSTSGTGYFDDASLLNATYYPTSTDIAAGSVTLTLTNSATSCSGGVLTDNAIITFLVAPSMSANTTEPVMCAKEASSLGVSLSGHLSNANTFTWTTTGTGAFVPNATSINTNYSPTSTEIASGSLSFTATATATNGCVNQQNVLVTFISSTASLTVMNDTAFCSDLGNYWIPISAYSSLQSNGTITWTGGMGSFDSPTNSSYYITSTDELATPSFTLKVNLKDNYGCGINISKQVVFTIDKKPTLDAGLDRNICQGTSTIAFNAVTTAPSITWSTNGSGTISNTSSPNMVYTLSAAEQGSTPYLYFQADVPAVGSCAAFNDYVLVYTITPPTINAGTFVYDICASQNAVTNASSSYGIESVSWTSNGTGTWMNQNSLMATYIPSSADRVSGSTVLTITGTSVCPSVSSSVTAVYNTKVVSVDAGGPYPVTCNQYNTVTSGYGVISLTGSYTGLTGTNPTTWTTSDGQGTTDDPYSSITNYNAGAYDGYNGPIHLVLIGYDGTCGYVSDTAVLTFNLPPAKYYSGTERGACKGDTLYLGGYSYLQAINYTMYNGGTGSFFANGATDINNPRYIPGSNDQTITFIANVVALQGCTDLKDTFNVNIHINPTVNAGSDGTICSPIDTLRMKGNVYVQQPLSESFNGYWYQSGYESMPEKLFDYPVVNFYRQNPYSNASMPDALADFSSATLGTYDLVWRIREYWNDIDNGYGYCVARDTIKVLYIKGGGIMPDTLTAMAGITRTKNLVANDSLYGQSYTVSLVDNGTYSQNTKSFDPATGILTYTNKSTMLNGRDTLRYSLSTAGCPGAHDTIIIVKLVNGAPFTPDTAKASTSVQKVKNVITTLPLNLSLVFADYNENIDWNTLTSPKNGSVSGVTISHDITDPPYLLTLTYSSERAALFTGEDVITFRVCDKLNACYTGKYTVNVIPDYTNPAVKPEDFQVVNAISPNGDGINDFMLVGGLGDYHNTVVIYNRWSQEVWRAENYNNTTVRFEGISTVKGLEGPLPEGTYFYVIKNEGKDENGEKTGLHSGYIELRR